MVGGVWLAVWLAALFAGAVYAALIQSLREVPRTALETRIASRPGVKARVEAILEDLDGHATALTLPRITCNLLVAAAMVIWISHLRGKPHVEWEEALFGVVATSILVWIVGTVFPLAIARHAGVSAVVSCSSIIRATYLATRPLLALSDLVDDLVRRLVGKTDEQEAEQRQEEILSAVQEATDEGQFDEREQEMIEAVVKFRDSTVAQIMTPRTQVEALPVTSNLGQVTAFIRRGGHSRIPVYEGTLDHVLGFFYVKDLMKWLAGDRSKGSSGFDLKTLLRPAIFVPETKTVRELLDELLSRRLHIAIVADEFGGTAGLVTIEDIIEEVFGDIQDEYETPEQSRDVQIDAEAKAAEVDARAYIEDVNIELHEALGIEIPESEDYDTVGGFVTVNLGRIPRAGEQMTHEGLKVQVLEAEPTRVTRIRLSQAKPEEAAAGRSEAGK